MSDEKGFWDKTKDAAKGVGDLAASSFDKAKKVTGEAIKDAKGFVARENEEDA